MLKIECPTSNYSLPFIAQRRTDQNRTVSGAKYVGDPLNAVRIFNEKEVDELIVLDINASTQGNEPDYGLIANLAGECRMPLSYGGGVKTTEQLERIVGLGVEKVAISSAAIMKRKSFRKLPEG